MNRFEAELSDESNDDTIQHPKKKSNINLTPRETRNDYLANDERNVEHKYSIDVKQINLNLIALPYPDQMVTKFSRRGIRSKALTNVEGNVSKLSIIIRLLKWFVFLQRPLLEYSDYLIYMEKWLVKNKICKRECYVK